MLMYLSVNSKTPAEQLLSVFTLWSVQSNHLHKILTWTVCTCGDWMTEGCAAWITPCTCTVCPLGSCTRVTVGAAAVVCPAPTVTYTHTRTHRQARTHTHTQPIKTAMKASVKSCIQFILDFVILLTSEEIYIHCHYHDEPLPWVWPDYSVTHPDTARLQSWHDHMDCSWLPE